MYNDGTFQVHDDTEEYIDLFENLIEKDLRVDGMGIQFHIGSSVSMLDGHPFPPQKLIDVYDRLGEMGLPLYITEITLGSAARENENGLMAQEKVVENLYRLWFSTPRMAGITWWNLADSTAFGNENKSLGGLIDAQLVPKPVYYVLDRLINHEWKTNITLKTGTDGKVALRGFYGSYSAMVEVKGRKQEFDFDIKSSQPNRVTLQLE